jgi:hypothetical protein
MHPADMLIIIMPFLSVMVLILAVTAYKVTKLIFDKPQPKNRVDAALETRIAQLEQRVVTLQDLIIGGEYEHRLRASNLRANTHIMPDIHDAGTPSVHRAFHTTDS